MLLNEKRLTKIICTEFTFKIIDYLYYNNINFVIVFLYRFKICNASTEIIFTISTCNANST